MIRNRKLAEERRLARLNQLTNDNTSNETEKDKPMEVIEEIIEINDQKTNEDINVTMVRKHNRSNVIDSSDDETSIMTVNESIQVDVHNHVETRKSDSDKENTDGTIVNPEIITNDGTTIETSDIEIDSIENTETVTDSHVPVIGSESFENDKTAVENNTNLDKIEMANDKSENNGHDKEESPTNNSKSKETTDKSAVTDDLMDMDFSEDF